MLHGLERTDRDAVLLALRRVRDGDVDGTAHHTDEVGAGQREPEGGPPGDVVRVEMTGDVGDE